MKKRAAYNGKIDPLTFKNAWFEAQEFADSLKKIFEDWKASDEGYRWHTKMPKDLHARAKKALKKYKHEWAFINELIREK